MLSMPSSTIFNVIPYASAWNVWVLFLWSGAGWDFIILEFFPLSPTQSTLRDARPFLSSTHVDHRCWPADFFFTLDTIHSREFHFPRFLIFFYSSSRRSGRKYQRSRMGKSIFFTQFQTTHNKQQRREHGRDDDMLRCNLASKMNCVFFNLIFIYFIFCIELLTGSGRSWVMLITIAGTSKSKTEERKRNAGKTRKQLAVMGRDGASWGWTELEF